MLDVIHYLMSLMCFFFNLLICFTLRLEVLVVSWCMCICICLCVFVCIVYGYLTVPVYECMSLNTEH